MPSVDQLRSRLLKKLAELFQLDQPDLDFGFYRIMHAKAQEVRDFIGNDLLRIVSDAFGDVDESRKAELKAAYEKAVQTARDFGAAQPEETEPVRKARAALDAVKDTASAEADVYDHLYRFFERYYEDGDFISRRYYTRETSGKAAPFAVPYNGEEVKLHWANADQYYIKSAEYFSNFTFDLRQAKEVLSHDAGLFEPQIAANGKGSMKVHFKIVDATEGEHGNVKAADANKRFFIIHSANPVALSEDGELIVHFEYRPDPEKTGQENTWRDKRNAEAVEAVFGCLEEMINHEPLEKEEQRAPFRVFRGAIEEYQRLLKIPAPTEKDKARPVLAKYINQYTARNTMDYFIHKDLGGFLRRELDFYIKNEVMRLDDIENADAPAVESYLTKIRVLRKIAGKLIDFLAQLEAFQKKLWLKKKFVLETQYGITLDRVPEDLYPEIIANEAQTDEWITLFAIDEIEQEIGSPGFSRPLTVAFLKANTKLVLDTRFFDEAFKARLVASIENFDEQCDGLLIHSENFQALNLLQERYREQVRCVYIDPPYNTSASEILYKNNYKHSSWLSMIYPSLNISKMLLNKGHGILCATIDDVEYKELSHLIEIVYGDISGSVSIRIKPSGRPIPNGFAISHEYAIFAKKNNNYSIARLGHSEEQKARYRERDEKGAFFWEMFRKAGSNSNRFNRPTMYYPFYFNTQTQTLRIPNLEFNDQKSEYIGHDNPHKDEVTIYPIKDDGTEGCWYFGYERAKSIEQEFKAQKYDNSTYRIYYRRRPNEGVQPTTLWFDSKYSATEHGTALLKSIFGEQETFSYPKSIHAVVDCLTVSGILESSQSHVLDYFAGSGTTGHAVINLNREDGGNRSYTLVEMGDHFISVLVPRLKKITYSENWKDGKPASRHTGMSHCFKTIRLESYEDTLNNLRFDENPVRTKTVNANPDLKEDYMLRYLLDVETRGSQSLLNIDAFSDPTAYTLNVKKPGTDQYVTRTVDLVETFNYLIGLRVIHMAEPQEFTAEFKRLDDPEAPLDQKTRLVIDGKIKQFTFKHQTHAPLDKESQDNPFRDFRGSNNLWWFRRIEGWVPEDPANPNNGRRENVLIVWRTLTGDLEKDNLMLDEWFRATRINPRDFEFDTIYVNGSNNLPNLKRDDENWKVRLIEEEFMKRMWEVQ